VEKGWIKLYRAVRGNWLWPQKKYSPLEAWIDLLLTANHSDGSVWIDGKLVPVPRGTLITSEVKLSTKWQWARKTVRAYLSALEGDNSITKKSTARYTTITLVNYGFYQDHGTALDTARGTTEAQVNTQLVTHKQEYKNERRKEINIYNQPSDKNSDIVADVISYLNGKARTKYRIVEATKKLIKARLNDGYSLDDFRTVIDKKCAEWLGTDQQKYLRPETLFGTKFDGYLNQLTGGNNGRIQLRDSDKPGTNGDADSAGKIPEGFWA
jgi:uncharacterized phage protein (TIGR02220 family)